MMHHSWRRFCIVFLVVSAISVTTSVLGAPTRLDGEDCSSPQPLAFGACVVDSTVGYVNDHDCGTGHAGPDRVYTFTLAAETNVRIVAEADFDADWSLSNTCSNTTASYFCADIEGFQRDPSCSEIVNVAKGYITWNGTLPAGTYYLWIDGYGSTYAGNYALELTTMLPGEQCVNVETLDQDSCITGSTVGYANDHDCGTGHAGPDRVYSLVLEEPMDIKIIGEADYDADWTLSTSCSLTSGSILCVDSNGFQTDPSCGSIVHNSKGFMTYNGPLAAGTYYIWVDGYSSTYAGNYAIEVTVPLAGEYCQIYETLALGQCLTGNTTGYANDHYPGTGHTGPDRVYQLVLSNTTHLKLISEADYNADFTIATSCSPSAADILNTDVYGFHTDPVCGDIVHSTSGFMTFNRTMDAGTYYIWIDGYNATTFGNYALEATTMLPGELCTNYETLTFGTCITGSTLGYANDHYPGTGHTGPDRVYQLVLSEETHFKAISEADYNADWTIATSCSPTTANILNADTYGYHTDASCGDIVHNASGFITFNQTLPAGTYYIWVDGYNVAAYGNYALETTVMLPGEMCSNYDTISFGECVTGTTIGYANDHYPGTGHNGPDRVYRLDLAEAKVLKFIGEADFNADWTIATTCSATTANILNCDTTGFHTDPSCGAIAHYTSGFATWNGYLNAGTYYIWVDGYNSVAEGNFAFETRESLPGEICSNYEDIVLGDCIVGSTVGYANDHTVNPAADRVYRLLLPSSTELKFVAEADFDADWVIATTCDASSANLLNVDYQGFHTNPACGDITNHAYGYVTWITTLGPGLYFIWIDGKLAASEGNYAFEFTVTEPGDRCSNVIPMSVGDCITGSTEGFQHDNDCGSYHDGPDKVYTFSLDVAKHIQFIGVADYNADWALSRVCDFSTGDIVCADYFGIQVNPSCGSIALDPGGYINWNGVLTPGVYYVWVDGKYSYSYGNYIIEIKEVMPGENCGSVEVIDIGQCIEGSTIGYANDVVCGSGHLGPDRVYEFVLNETQYLELVGIANYDADWVLATTCNTGSEYLQCPDRLGIAIAPSCGDISQDAYGHIHWSGTLGPGSYFIWVDGKTATSAGDYVLELKLAQPGDLCGVAETIQFGQCIEGSTVGYTNYHDCGTSHYGVDRVYQFVLTEKTDIQVLSEADYAASFTLATTCSATAGEVFCYNYYGKQEDTSCGSIIHHSSGYVNWIGTLDSGTYYFWIDGDSTNDSGNYSIEIKELRAGEFCNNAQSVNVGECVVDTNAFYLNDHSCGSGHYGRDRVYQLMLPETTYLQIVGEADYNADWTLASSCSSSAGDIFCVTYSGTPSDPVCSGIVHEASSYLNWTGSLPAGVYYLWVDADNINLIGTYAFEIKTPMPGESCGDPEAIACGQCIEGSTVGFNNDHDCGTGHGGPDRLYTFTLEDIALVSVVGEADYNADWTIATTCSLSGAEVICSDYLAPQADPPCGSITHATNSYLNWSGVLSAGTYYLWVDGNNASGNYAFQVVCSEVTATATNTPTVTRTPNPLSPTPTPTRTPTTTLTPTPTALAHDDCTDPEMLYVGDCVVGSTVGFRHDHGCTSGRLGPDRVYRLLLPDRYNLQIIGEADYDADWTLSSICSSSSGDIACSDTYGFQQDPACSSITNHTAGFFTWVGAIGPGTYYIWVDSKTGSTSGSYALEIMGALAGDICANAELLDVGDCVTDSTVGYAHDHACTTGRNGPDRVYRVDLLEARTLQILGEADYDADWTISTACTTSSATITCSDYYGLRVQPSCSELTYQAGSILNWVGFLEPTTLYIWVDSKTGSVGGNYTLEIKDAPPGEMCGNPETIYYGECIIDTTVGYTDDQRCATGRNGPDRVYRLVVDETKPVQIIGEADYDADWTIATYCSASGNILCTDYTGFPQDPSCSTIAHSPNGYLNWVGTLTSSVYYIWVDSKTGDGGGTFALEIKTPMIGEFCSNPENLDFDQCVTGSTLNYANEQTCATGRVGPDRVYELMLPQTTNVQILGEAVYDADWTIASYCSSSGNLLCADYNGFQLDVSCGDIVHQASGYLNWVSSLTAGVYYIWVDTKTNQAGGDYALEVVEAKPGEFCSNAEYFNLGECILASTVDYANDHDCGTGHAGPDRVYWFMIPEVATVTIIGEADFDADWSIATYCSTSGNLLCSESYGTHADPGCGSIAHHTAGFINWSSDLNPGVYYVWVDGYGPANAGAYALQITSTLPTATPTVIPSTTPTGQPTGTSTPTKTYTVTPSRTPTPTRTPTLSPTPAISGDSCVNPIVIQIDACVEGSTVGTQNNYDPNCGDIQANFYSNDVVYQLTLTSEQTITVIGEADFDADWAMATSCDTLTPDIFCLDHSATHVDPYCGDLTHYAYGYVNETIILQAGTYYIWVDGTALEEGAYILQITAAVPTETPTPAVTSTMTATSTLTPSLTPSQSPTLTPTWSPTLPPSLTPTAIPTNTTTPTITPTSTPSLTPTSSPTETPTLTPTLSPTATPTLTPTASPTDTPSPTPTIPIPTLTPTPACLHTGDVNFDNDVTAGDSQIAFFIMLGSIIPSFEEACAADCNGDGDVTAGDAQLIFFRALGMPDSHCVDPLVQLSLRSMEVTGR